MSWYLFHFDPELVGFVAFQCEFCVLEQGIIIRDVDDGFACWDAISSAVAFVADGLDVLGR